MNRSKLKTKFLKEKELKAKRYEKLCMIWQHLYNFRNVKNIHVTPWVFLMFFTIVQMVQNCAKLDIYN